MFLCFRIYTLKRIFKVNGPVEDNLSSMLDKAQEITTTIRSSLEAKVIFISSTRGIVPED